MDISFPNGDQGRVSGIYGTVHGLRRWSDTHVSSSGGDGYLHNGSGHISAPRVRSRIVERVEFWLRPAAGGGNELRLTVNVDVRDGHRLVAIWGSARGEPDGTFLFILNQDSSQQCDLAAKTTFERSFLGLAVARNRQDIVTNLRNRSRSLSACVVLVMLGIALFPAASALGAARPGRRGVRGGECQPRRAPGQDKGGQGRARRQPPAVRPMPDRADDADMDRLSRYRRGLSMSRIATTSLMCGTSSRCGSDGR